MVWGVRAWGLTCNYDLGSTALVIGLRVRDLESRGGAVSISATPWNLNPDCHSPYHSFLHIPSRS